MHSKEVNRSCFSLLQTAMALKTLKVARNCYRKVAFDFGVRMWRAGFQSPSLGRGFCLWRDTAAGTAVSNQEGATASAGLHCAELLLPRQHPTQVQVDARGQLMGSEHKGSKQDEPTKYQGTGHKEPSWGATTLFQQIKSRSCQYPSKTEKGVWGLGPLSTVRVS